MFASGESSRAAEILKSVDIKLYGPLPEGIANQAVIVAECIGQGDEVFIIGLFSNHPGKLRNIPIVRVGNIAAMPGERVNSRHWHNRDIEAYLIESRSIGGLSGSPVFVHLGPIRPPKKVGEPVQIMGHRGGPHYLLGLVHGHFDLTLPDINMDAVDSVDTVDAAARVEINSGIALVVPVSKIIEVLNHPQLAEDRKRVCDDIERQRSATLD
jgi:hypothetical protein